MIVSCESLIGCYPNPRQKGHPCSLNEPCFGDRCCDEGLKCELPPTPIKPNTGLCVSANPPTKKPTSPMPTIAPTRSPTGTPTELPSSKPSITPTKRPTSEPTKRPSVRPSLRPSKAPTDSPLEALSKASSTTPTTQPSLQPIPAPPVPAQKPPKFTYKKAKFQTCAWLGQLPAESVATICRTRTKSPSARTMCPQTCSLSQLNRSAEAENKYLHRKKTKKSCDWLRNRSDRATICSKNKNARWNCASEC